MSKRLLGALKIVCGKTGAEEDMYEDDVEDERVLYDASESRSPDRPFYWSAALQRSFREELEKCGHSTLRPSPLFVFAANDPNSRRPDSSS